MSSAAASVKEAVALVLAQNHGAFQELVAACDALGPAGGHRWMFREAVPPIANLQSLFGSEPTYAFVIAVDTAMLRDAKLAETLDPLLQHVAEHPEFMLLPWLRGVSLQELQDAALAGGEVATAIVENIHIDASLETLDGVARALYRHLGSFWKLEERRFFRGLATRLARKLDLVAWAVVATLAVMAQALWSAHGNPDSPWDAWIFWPRTISVLAVVALLIVLYDLTWRILYVTMSMAMGRSGRLGVLLANGIVLCLCGYWIASVRDMKPLLAPAQDGPGYVLGFGVGLALIALIRTGRRASHEANLARMPGLLESDRALPDFRPWVYRRFVLTATRLLPSFHKQFFVSYSHSSPWCVSAALDITRRLKSLGAPVFLDRDSLQPGEAWKARLHDSLSDIDVVVMVVDERARRKKWVAAEFMAAIVRRAMQGRPRLVVVHPPEFTPVSPGDTPISRLLAGVLAEMARGELWWMQPQFVPYREEAAGAVCEDLRYGAGARGRGHVAMPLAACGLLLLFLGGIPLLVAWTSAHVVSSAGVAAFVHEHVALVRVGLLVSAASLGFGVAYTLFGLTSRTRLAGVIGLAGHGLTLLYAQSVCNYVVWIAAALVFHLGLSIAHMLLREWRSHGILQSHGNEKVREAVGRS